MKTCKQLETVEHLLQDADCNLVSGLASAMLAAMQLCKVGDMKQVFKLVDFLKAWSAETIADLTGLNLETIMEDLRKHVDEGNG